MVATSPTPNNIKIAFRNKAERERTMPPVSGQQAKAMFSAASGKSNLGIPKKVGEEFTEDLGPGDVKALPKRKASRADRLRSAGRISDKQHARFVKDTDGNAA